MSTEIKPFKIQIRFSDCDMLGHVNNAVYVTYFENARVYYLRELLGKDWNWNQYSMLVKKNEVEYFRPLLLNDDAEIFIKTDYIGNKSFTVSYELKVNDQVYTSGKTVLVCFDLKQNCTTEVYAPLKEVLTQLM